MELSQFEIDQQLYDKAKIDETRIVEGFSSIGAWFSTHLFSKYYCLMCRDKKIPDVTIFHFNNMHYAQGVEEVKEVLQSRGRILDIVYDHVGNAYKCWVRTKDDGKPNVFYLFESGKMVVEVE